MYHRKQEAGGPIAFLKEGDIISYNIPNRTIDIVGIEGKKVSPEEVAKVLEERKKDGIKPRPERKGLLGRYTSHALSAMKGAGY